MNDFQFKCPHCGHMISLNEIVSHEGDAFNEFLNNKFQEKIIKEKSELKDQISKEKELELKAALSNKENEFISKIKDKENEIQRLNDNLKNSESKIKSEYEVELSKIKLQLTEQSNKQLELLKEQLNKLKETNINLTNKLDSLSESKEREIKIEVAKTKELFNDKIQKLEIANATNRLIHSKSKGENFEHEVEGELRKSFGFTDFIEKITVGEKKADYLQVVKNQANKEMGKIVYEVKNATWSDAWLPKLQQDVANNDTKYGVLIATSFDTKFHDVPFVKSDISDTIFITDPESFVFVGQMLRRLIEIEYNYKILEKRYTQTNDNELLTEYAKKIDAIKSFMISDLPKFIKSFKTQLKTIETVRNSLNNNSDKLATAHNQLQSKFEKQIKDRLEKITDIRVIEEGE